MTFCLNINPIKSDGSLIFTKKSSVAGRTYTKVCGRGCILLNNKVWNICEHNKIVFHNNL